MSDAECWKLNRMRQLEDENIRLLRENAELKALLIERVKPDFPKGAELTSFTISDSNTGKVIDVLGGNSALYAKLGDPKPQGEE